MSGEITSKTKRKFIWLISEILSTGILWIIWIVGNNANNVIFLPRQFNIYNLIVYLIIGVISILSVVLLHGGKMQDVLEEKDLLKNI